MSILEAQSGRVLGTDGRRNICELPINVVTLNKPNVLLGLSQKARGMDNVLFHHITQLIIPPANRQSLTHPVKLTKLGKPNAFHKHNMETPS